MNKKVAIVLQNMCRTCMRQFSEAKNVSRSILEVATKSRKTSIVQLLQKVYPKIKVTIEDELPILICYDCEQKLIITYEFIEMYKNSDKNLRKLLEDAKISDSENDINDLNEESLYKYDIYGINKYALEIEELNKGIGKVDRNQNKWQELHEIPKDIEAYFSNPYSNGSDDEWMPNSNSQNKTYTKITAINENEDFDKTSDDTISNNDNYEINYDYHEITNYDNKVITSYDNNKIICDNKKISTKNISKKLKDQKGLPILKNKKQTVKQNELQPLKNKKSTMQQHEFPSSKNKKETVEQNEHPDEFENGNIPCKECEVVLENLELWLEHMGNHQLEKRKNRYKCEHCGKVFAKGALYKTHLRIHTGEEPYLCYECGKGFKAVNSFKIHMLRHKGVKNYQCKQCPKKFVCSSGLINHMMVHTKEKPFVCDVCGRAFHMAIHLRKHKLYHDGIKNFPCDFCDKKFVLAEQQRRHMRTHTGEKPYHCKYCEKAFSQSNDYIKHMRLHLGNNVYQCELCPQGFPLARDLQTHFATHREDDEETRARNLQARLEKERNLQIKLSVK